jgi:hypothetical protein
VKQLTYRVVVTVPEEGGGPADHEEGRRSMAEVRRIVEDSLESLVGALDGLTVTYASLGWAYGLPEVSER